MFKKLMKAHINDIDTNPDQPLVFKSIRNVPELKDQSQDYNPNFKETQLRLYPDLKSYVTQQNPEIVYQHAVALAQQLKWNIHHESLQNLEFEATEITPVLKFKDDIMLKVFLFNGSAIVQMRSRSRLGKHDFGANAKRIDRFFKALELALRVTPIDRQLSKSL